MDAGYEDFFFYFFVLLIKRIFAFDLDAAPEERFFFSGDKKLQEPTPIFEIHQKMHLLPIQLADRN